VFGISLRSVACIVVCPVKGVITYDGLTQLDVVVDGVVVVEVVVADVVPVDVEQELTLIYSTMLSC
jgi:hypothetical protein